jgi:hypothetical protein
MKVHTYVEKCLHLYYTHMYVPFQIFFTHTHMNTYIPTYTDTQRVPRSQRGGEIIEPLISTQWFVRTRGMADKGIDAVRSGKMKIIPERFEKTWYVCMYLCVYVCVYGNTYIQTYIHTGTTGSRTFTIGV